MKTKPFLIPLATLLVAGFASPGVAQNPPPLPVDPASGLAVASPAGAPTTMMTTAQEIQARQDLLQQLHQLISTGDYDQALKDCLLYQSELKGDQTVTPILADWVELGRRFPAARDALLKVRDHDVSEFSAGHGYAVLFSEVQAINAALNDDAATEALFKSVCTQDRNLAEECYGYIQDQLVQKGEYSVCLDFMGDPRAHFESLHDNFQMTIEMQQRQAGMRSFMAEQARKLNRPVPPVFAGMDQGKMATNNFVVQVVVMEKILAGAGRTADAEIVRDQALAVVDDDRIRSAYPSAAPKPAP